MRQAREFFRAELTGLYSFDEAPAEFSGDRSRHVRVVDEPQEISAKDRRELGVGRWRETVRLVFGPWEIFIRSTNDAPPLGEVSLIDAGDVSGRKPLVSGPLDPLTWTKIGTWIKSRSHQRRIAS